MDSHSEEDEECGKNHSEEDGDNNENQNEGFDEKADGDCDDDDQNCCKNSDDNDGRLVCVGKRRTLREHRSERFKKLRSHLEDTLLLPDRKEERRG